jgi:PAS domain S-box-containing protein
MLCFVPFVSAATDFLNVNERAWLTAHPKIRVAISPDYAPISYLNAQSQPVGLAVDYLALIQKKIDVKFDLVVPTPEQRANNSPKDKQVDVVSVFAETPSRHKYWVFTEPILDFPLYILQPVGIAKITNLKVLSHQKVSVVIDYAAKEYLQQNYPDIELNLADDTCEAMQHVMFGQSQALLSDLPVATWCIKTTPLLRIKIANKTEFSYRLGMGVRQDWPMLLTILNKGLASISAQERQEIDARWADTEQLSEPWTQKYKFWITTLLLVGLGTLLAGLFSWDAKLQANALNSLLVESHALPAKLAPVRGLSSHMLVLLALFLFAIIAAFSVFVINHEWVTRQDRLILILSGGFLTLLTILGGYKLGNLRRARESERLFTELMQQVETRQSSERLLEISAQRQIVEQTALAKLNAFQNVNSLPELVFKEITELSADTLQVDRVSVWLFSDDFKTLNCVDLYQRQLHAHSSGMQLQAKNFPNYFKALAESRVIAANDARQHVATQEFKAGYLPNLNIGAILDATIWYENNMVGVICHEHIGGIRYWAQDEQNFAGSMADQAKFSMAEHQKILLESALNTKQKALKNVQNKILAIESSAKLFHFLVERSPVGVIYMDGDGVMIGMNAEAERLTGYQSKMAVGKIFKALFSSKTTLTQHMDFLRQVKNGQKVQNISTWLRRADGSEVEIIVSGTMEIGTDGKPVIIAIGQDMTQQKLLEKSLITAKEAAESADRIKSMFVASMSHELRTPLNSIIGFLGIVLQGMSGKLNDQQTNQLGRAYHSAKHLLSLISDVIDISKIEAGYLQTHVEKFDLTVLISEILDSVKHMADDKQLTLTLNMPNKLILETDRKRMYQVILNVVSNAIKYTEKGNVWVDVSNKKQAIELSVKDTGIGISEAGLAKLFHPFERMESRLKIKTLGTGLGLYLTKKILTQLLGGDIVVTSEPEVGSKFLVTVPKKSITIQPPEQSSVL